MAESEEELKSLLMKVKEESLKGGLKLAIQKKKIMASGPIFLQQIDGETMETVRDFIFLGSRITAYGNCSYEIKRCLLLGRKAMRKHIKSILKSRDNTLLTKVYLVKAMVFPVVMDGCESWTIKKLSAKESMLLNHGTGEGNRKLFEIPLDSKEIKPVNPKGNQSEYSLEGLMLKLKLQYFDHLI